MFQEYLQPMLNPNINDMNEHVDYKYRTYW